MKALEITDLKKTYKSGVEALKGVSLCVDQGDFYALLGPNGAGKSTLIGIVCSLVIKSGGSVSVFGHNIDNELDAAKSRIGMVPQEFNFNLFEKVEQVLVNQAGYYGVDRPTAYRRAEICLRQLDILDKRHTISRELSGGMKRRLMIARALMHEPDMLILDEPTAGVDIELRRSTHDFLRRINDDGVTIILTTHYLEEAEMLCRNIGIIHHGELMENTSMKELLTRLDMETFVLDLAPGTSMPTLEGITTRTIDDHTLEVDVKRGAGLNDVFSQLSAQGVRVLSMKNKVNRLEELFMTVVKTPGRE